jgi:hypothetical protein
MGEGDPVRPQGLYWVTLRDRNDEQAQIHTNNIAAVKPSEGGSIIYTTGRDESDKPLRLLVLEKPAHLYDRPVLTHGQSRR